VVSPLKSKLSLVYFTFSQRSTIVFPNSRSSARLHHASATATTSYKICSNAHELDLTDLELFPESLRGTREVTFAGLGQSGSLDRSFSVARSSLYLESRGCVQAKLNGYSLNLWGWCSALVDGPPLAVDEGIFYVFEHVAHAQGYPNMFRRPPFITCLIFFTDCEKVKRSWGYDFQVYGQSIAC
jgi:hypothetical protein